jgi:pilus assembly protein CpaB
MKLALPAGFRINKTVIALVVALLIGLSAALGARSYLSGRVADLEARARGKTVSLVVAKVDIPKGTKLTNANLAVRPIPVDFAHSGAVSPEQFDRIAGQPVAFNIKAGEMLMWGLLEGKKVPTFSAKVEAGRRAITVQVDEINSISGMLEPSDQIDLLVTLDQKGRKAVVPFLLGVKVLATGQRTVDDPKTGEKRQYSTVTLDTSTEQAQNVVLAKDSGKLTALLRNPEDRLTTAVTAFDMSSLTQGKGMDAALRPGGAADVKEIPVLYSGRKLPPGAQNLGSYAPPSAASGGTGAPASVMGLTEALGQRQANEQPVRVQLVNTPPTGPANNSGGSPER